MFPNMKRGFLLSDNEKLNISISPKLSEKMEVKREIVDADFGISMIRMTAHNEGGMNLKIKTDKHGVTQVEATDVSTS